MYVINYTKQFNFREPYFIYLMWPCNKTTKCFNQVKNISSEVKNICKCQV